MSNKRGVATGLVLIIITIMFTALLFPVIQWKHHLKSKAEAKKTAGPKLPKWMKKGRMEWEGFSQTIKDTTGIVPFHSFDYGMAYRIAGSAEGGDEEQAFTRYRFQEKRLDKSELNQFFSILNDKTSYGLYGAACFEPGLAVVLYDSIQKPVQAFAICLDCNHIESRPKISAKMDRKLGFSFRPEAIRKLKTIFNEQWNMHYYACSELFETEKECEKYRIMQIKDSLRIRNELEMYKKEMNVYE